MRCAAKLPRRGFLKLAVRAAGLKAVSAESAPPGFDAFGEAHNGLVQTVAWSALFMPKGVPKVAIQRVNAAVQKAMEDPAIAKRLAEIGADIPPSDQRTPQALERLVAMEIDKWVPLIKAAGIAAE